MRSKTCGLWALGLGPWDVRAQRGVSLVEATIVLAVFSLMTAVLSPVVNDYVSDAKETRARNDTSALASAMSRMLVDVGETMFLRDGNGAAATNPPSRATSNRVNLLVGTGNIPNIAASVDRAGGNTDWDDALDSTTVWSFYAQLNANTPGYRSGAEMSVTDEFDPDGGSGGNSEFFWRGAYLTPIVGPDPWGNRYMSNVEFLGRPNATTPSENDVFVLSAGPNGRVDTSFAATTPTFATDNMDDTHAMVSGGGR